MDETQEKKRIRAVIEEVDGEQVPSPDSLTEVKSDIPNEAVEMSQEIEKTEEVKPESNILSEETKDSNIEGMEPVEKMFGSEQVNTDVRIVSPPPEPIEKKGSKLTIFLIVVLVALVVALLAGGIYVYTNGTVKNTPLPTPTPLSIQEPTETPVASASPSASLDLIKLKLSILNGSGKIGEAGKVKALIEKQGFKVASTGNASTFDFTDTVIQAKETVDQATIDKLKDSLAESYKVKIGEALKSTNTFDIVITVGSK